jgi:L-lactate dehydrogenase complex protein LldG
MASRDEILRDIRRTNVKSAALPTIEGDWITYADRPRQFATSLEFVGGRCHQVQSVSEIDGLLAQIPAWTSAVKTISRVTGAGRSTFDLDAVDDPHQLEDVDFAILPGHFGVAENGAIWVTGDGLKHRALYFIVQHLAIVLSAEQLVDNMHQAYTRLSFPGVGFGMFLSGPSKTADIEQSLVIGAHGPRSMNVFLVGTP